MDDLFTIDKNNDSESTSSEDDSEVEKEVDDTIGPDDETDSDIECLNPKNVKIIKNTENKKTPKGEISESELAEFERDMGWGRKNRRRRKAPKFDKSIVALINDVAPVDDVLKKSVVKDGFERLKRVPKYDPSDKKLKQMRKRQREKTKGDKWYNLPATEITDEVRHDLEIIQKRAALDPKHFYKKNDTQVLPKYFHIGKVVDTPLDYYNGRLTKKERKRTIVDELMADAEFSKYNKRKYKEIIDEKKKTHYKAYQQAKKQKRKKKN